MPMCAVCTFHLLLVLGYDDVLVCTNMHVFPSSQCNQQYCLVATCLSAPTMLRFKNNSSRPPALRHGLWLGIRLPSTVVTMSWPKCAAPVLAVGVSLFTAFVAASPILPADMPNATPLSAARQLWMGTYKPMRSALCSVCTECVHSCSPAVEPCQGSACLLLLLRCWLRSPCSLTASADCGV